MVACYATRAVAGNNTGGLLALNIGSTVKASYFAGSVTGVRSYATAHGVRAQDDGSSETCEDVYYDSDTTGLTAGNQDRSTWALQSVTTATGIYANWDDLDVRGDGTADEDPWDFGSTSQYPALSYGSLTAAAQRTVDYDDDNLIDIRTLAQLNAVRYDLDGNGTVSAADATNYSAAFPGRTAAMGCASTCAGYELRGSLNFDTDGDGDVDSADTGSYPNWSPIGGTYSATFEGNGHTISHLTIVNATGIYADWDDLDVNGNGTADEDPWDFGAVNQYPVLGYGS